MTPPPCPCCQLQQRPLYCAACLREGIALHNDILRNLQAQIDGIIQQSRSLLEGGVQHGGPSGLPLQASRGVNAWRELRAQVAVKERRSMELRRAVADRDEQIAVARQNVVSSEQKTGQRRIALVKLQTAPSPTIALQNAIKVCRLEQQEVSSRIIHARRVLVKEAVAVFGIKKRSMGEWEIAGLVLPGPDAFRLHPSTTINAALSHTLHLLALVTDYLSITLPFIPTPPSPQERRHIGRPVMKSNTPFIGTTKWRDKHVLWMSSTASIASKIKSRNSLSSSKVFAQPNVSAIIAKSMSKHRQFLTSFALLAFSIAYLAWSQDVPGVGIRDGDDYGDDSDEENPRPDSRQSSYNPNSSVLISATSILELLHSVSISPRLGLKTHEPGTNKVLPHLGFGMDVAKVVQSVLSAEENRWGAKPADGSGEELSEGWDLLDAEKH